MGLGVAEQVAPDGGHPGRERRPVPGDDGGQRLGLEELLGHDQVGTGHEPAVGGPPGVGVEHGDDGQHPVELVDPERRARGDGHRVQEGRAVAVDHALRVAGGSRRVTHGRGLALVEGGPVVARLLGLEQLLVGERRPERAGVAVPGHDDVLDGGQLVPHPGQQRDQHGVDDDHLVLGVVDHVGRAARGTVAGSGCGAPPPSRGWPGRPPDGSGCSTGRCPPGRRRPPRAGPSALASRSARSATSVNDDSMASPAGPVMVITWLSP